MVKECIHEVLLEEGLLSNVVAEVAQGLQGNLVVDSREKEKQQCGDVSGIVFALYCKVFLQNVSLSIGESGFLFRSFW